MSCIEERIKNGFTKIDKEIEALGDELKTESQGVKEDLNKKTDTLNVVWEELVKEKNQSLQTCLDNTEKENLNPKKEVSGLKHRLVKQEDYSRRENLRFYNIPEDPEETTEAELCSDCKGCFSRAWSPIKHKVPCNSLLLMNRQHHRIQWGSPVQD